MNWLRLARARFFGLFHKGVLEEEMDEELRFHLAMRTQEYIERGMSPAEAQREARLQFGNVNLIKDACRDVNGGGWLEVVWQDVRFATRMLVRDRGFTAIAVLALALGIGANTALFTVMSNVLLRPLPYAESNQLMSIWSKESGANADHRMLLSYPDFRDLVARNQTFEQMGGFRSDNFVVKVPGSDVTEMQGSRTTSQVLNLLGAQPVLGKTFDPSDDELGSRAVVISHQLWQERFGGSPDVINATMSIDGRDYSVCGVMPSEFRFPVQNVAAQFWVTFSREHELFPDGGPAITSRRAAHLLNVVGRLKPNVTRAMAEEDLSAIAAEVAVRIPETNARMDACSVIPLLADITQAVRPALLLLVGAALCVLCVACVNVANLLLARAGTRQKEIAIRSALGAGRRRILRQLLTESLVLASLGGSVGLVLAIWGTRYIVTVLPPSFPRLDEIMPDVRVLSFTCLMTLLTSCFFGFAPAWRSAHCDLASILNDASRGSSEPRRARQARRLLVIGEMVLSFVLLTGACCLIRTLWKLENAEPGFNPRNLLTAHLSLPEERGVEAPARSSTFYRELLKRLSQTEGIQSASAVYPLPLTAYGMAADFEILGRSGLKADWPRARTHAISLKYFTTMEIPLLQGRDFDERDQRDGAQVVIINETLARTFFGNENPLGKIIRPGLTDSSVTAPREIVGVVGDVKATGLAAEQRPEVYIPHTQCASTDMGLVIRTTASPDKLLATLRTISKELDDRVPIYGLSSMEEYLSADIAQPRLSSTLLGAFAFVAVFLTAIGVYGVTAYSVARRRHEIGIRLALGAQKRAVFSLLMGEGMRLIGWSILGGGLLTLGAAPFLRTFAVAAGENQTGVILFVTLLLSGVGLLACSLPAHRAAGEDPLAAIGER